MTIITETALDFWVQNSLRVAQEAIPEFVDRLVQESCSAATERRFPINDGINQPGPDGFLVTSDGFPPYVPSGASIWEIGTGNNPGDKATADYNKATKHGVPYKTTDMTFVFVTPLSAVGGWDVIAQTKWVEERKKRNEWKDVKVIDGTKLIGWLRFCPVAYSWLATKMGISIEQIQSIELRWESIRTIGSPPNLPPQLFLANRSRACDKLRDVFTGSIPQLQIDTYYQHQVPNFIAAYVASMSESERNNFVHRCLIISSPDVWDTVMQLSQKHFIIATFDINTDTMGAIRLNNAKNRNHAVIYAGMPGGIPHPHRVDLLNPNDFQIQEALETAGYAHERARMLARKCGRNLNWLILCIQNLSLMPEWSQNVEAAELAIVELLGGWNENFDDDKRVVEQLSGNAYGEWIGAIRRVANRPNTPLSQRDSVWKFVARYEGWYALGKYLSDAHLTKFREIASDILTECDPQFELPTEKRYAATIYGKALSHSYALRNGMAETLALLGSHPKALTSCSAGKAEATATLAVRDILANADWIVWASLNDILPLLAEAAPKEFLDRVEAALDMMPCPFNTIYAQEASGIFGRNYLTGLLWALETLAWSEEYLIRVVALLGELAILDPGGNWANRPVNSLATILTPWFPQTCASLSKRQMAVDTLLQETPEVAWNLLLSLLPEARQMSLGSHKPTWRDIIPESHEIRVTPQEYGEQVEAYSALAVTVAGSDVTKLVSLIERIGTLPPNARRQFLSHLSSDTITSLPQEDRTHLWEQLEEFILQHRRFAGADWSMDESDLKKIVAVSQGLAPVSSSYRYQYLFTDRIHDLFESNDNYEEQTRTVARKRREAVSEIFTTEGVEVVLDLAKKVESAWALGISFGELETNEVDTNLLPTLLNSEEKSLVYFVGGFILGRFERRKWEWVDNIDFSQWSPAQVGHFLIYLPFNNETWEHSTKFLGEFESEYWTRTYANPYQADTNLEYAVDRLLENRKVHLAIRCFDRLLRQKRPFVPEQALRVLDAVHSIEDSNTLEPHYIIEIIKALQEASDVSPAEIIRIEWAFLPLLNQRQGAHPIWIEQELSDNPEFFCQMVRIVFKARNEETPKEPPTEQQQGMAQNGYRLLSEWRIPPGTQKDSVYRGDLLSKWLKEVRLSCAASGHLEVALSMLGKVLTHTPPDPTGLWIHRDAAAELNARDAKEMRSGFYTALINSRGVYGFSSGADERALATTYRQKADDVENAGYHRLASSLKDLANGYDLEAERAVTESEG